MCHLLPTSTLALALCFCSVLCGAASAALDERAPILDAIVARVERLRALEVRFNMREEYNPPAFLAKQPITKLPGGGVEVLRTKPRALEQRFSYLDGNALYESRPARDGPPEDPRDPFRESTLEVMAYSADREEQLVVPPDGKDARGAIRNRRTLPRSVVDVGLGLRQEYQDMWLRAEVLREMELRLADDGTAVLERVDDKGRMHRLTFAPAMGYALTKYQVLVTAEKWVNVEIECAQFNNVNGVMLPFSLTKRIFYRSDGKSTVTTRTSLTVTGYKLGPPPEGVDGYRITWPAGTVVSDARTKALIKVGATPRRLDDDEIARELRERDENRANNLQQTQRRIEEILSRPPATLPPAGGK